MGFVGAQEAYARGFTGQGIAIGIVDDGIDVNQRDLQGGAISNLSTDIVTSPRNNGAGLIGAPSADGLGKERHGTRVAGILGARFNGFGTIGVAYDSTIIAVRADEPGPCDQDNCKFRSSDLANAIDYLTNNGAKIINLSLGADGPSGSLVEQALIRAAQRGVVIIASSGNENEAANPATDPGWPARYAIDPRFAGMIISVNAHDQNGVIAGFSNRAGVALNWTLTAPGESVITDCDGTSCWRVGGTSFAAPHVSGAAALLTQAFPTLRGDQIVQLLLRSARDAGDPGADSVYGRGYLDIARAFQPIGGLSLPSPAQTPEAGRFSGPGGAGGVGMIGAAFGDALRAPALATMALDDFDRPFAISLADTLLSDAPSTLDTPAPRLPQTLSIATPEGLSYAISFRPLDWGAPDSNVRPIDRLTETEHGAAVRLRAHAGEAWSFAIGLRDDAATAAIPPVVNGFARFAGADTSVEIARRLGSGTVRVSAQHGAGREGPLDLAADRWLTQAGFLTRRGPVDLELGVGLLSERNAVLGLRWGERFGARPDGRTATVSANAAWAPASPWRVSMHAEAGRSVASRDGLFRVASPLRSSAYAAQLTFAPTTSISESASWRLAVSQPLRIESGALAITLADFDPDMTKAIRFTERRLAAAPSGREVVITAGYDHWFGTSGLIGFTVERRLDPDHRAGADSENALVLRGAWRR